jgi:hypothetical protein
MTFFLSPLANVLAGVLFAGTGATLVAATAKPRTDPAPGTDSGARQDAGSELDRR